MDPFGKSGFLSGESLPRQSPDVLQLPTDVQGQNITVPSPSIPSLVGDNFRVVVVLDSGAQVTVLISNAVTSEQLRMEAIRRAAALNLPCSSGNCTLRVGGFNGPIISGDDRVLDVLDLAENHTFYLGPLEVPPSAVADASSIDLPTSDSASSTTISTGESSVSSSKIYVRWITAGRALEHSYLKSIPYDSSSVSSDTTLSSFRCLAYERLYLSKSSTEETPPPGATAELFLLNSYLSTHTSSALTLGDLGLEGSKSDPLDIFVVLRSKETAANRPRDSYAFRSTDRGMATFHTSLTMLFKQIEDGRQTLPNALEILWEITHFPPALIAFRQLFENGIQPSPFAIFAACFREVCLRMVPPWIASTPESVFEGSRQIFAWFYSLHPEELSDSGVSHRLVHAVEISEVVSGHVDDIHGTFVNNDVVRIPDLSHGTAQPATKKVLVSKENQDQVMPRLLALTLNGSYNAPCNYYLDFPASATSYLEHRRVPLLHPSGFDNLLRTTNHSEAFKMIGPLQLSSSKTPLITLNKDGYTSVYDLKDLACGEGYPCTRNLITGEETLMYSDPGQYLLQKLMPVISNRRKDGSWEVDAWDDHGQVGSAVAAEEAIVICVDQSYSMSTAMGKGWVEQIADVNGPELSRLSEVKEVFQNLVARIAAYKLHTHLGLITFSGRSDVGINQDLTPVLYDFKDRLMGICPSGFTAMWDALVKAKEMLAAFKVKNPAARCRIIILTDGEDNSSKYLPEFACKSLYDAEIVLDSIVIGTTSTQDLFKISMHTGGYAFCPETRAALFQIFLLETLIDIKIRPDIMKVPITKFSVSVPKLADMSTPFDFPPCRPHENLNDMFIALRDASRFLVAIANRSNRSTSSASSIFSGISLGGNTIVSGVSSASGAGGSGRVFLNEAKAIIDNPHDHLDVYVSESNMGFWKVVMEGPPASPYEDGTFVLYVEIGDQFPRKAPTVRFITPILHPNITKHGRICHPIFDREWTSSVRVYQVLQQVWGILMSLEVRDTIDPLFTLKFWTDPQSARDEVASYIQRFASKSRELLHNEIIGASTSSSLSIASDTPSSSARIATPSLHSVATRSSGTGSGVGSNNSSGPSRRSFFARLYHARTLRRSNRDSAA